MPNLLENYQNRLRQPPRAVERCSRSSYEDDDGRMQGGKSTATREPEFQMVNKVAGVVCGHVMCCHTEKLSKSSL